MATEADSPVTRWASSRAIYGVVSVAVVIVAWEFDGDRWDLAGLIAGYLLVLLVTHTYAHVVGSGLGGTWRTAIPHELPVAVGGIPALVIAVVGALAKWNYVAMWALALVACGLTLFAMQIAILRPGRTTTRGRIIASAIFDLLAGVFVVGLHVLIH